MSADRGSWALAARLALGAGLVMVVVTAVVTYGFLSSLYWLVTGIGDPKIDLGPQAAQLWGDVPGLLVAWTLTVLVWFVAAFLLGRRSLEPGAQERATGASVLLALWLVLIGPMVALWLGWFVGPLLGVRTLPVAVAVAAFVYVGGAVVGVLAVRRSRRLSEAADEEQPRVTA